MHARFRCEGERAGVVRPVLRQLGDVLVDRLQRRHEKRIFARIAPAGERQPARRSQCLAHVGEGERGFGEEHHAEPRDQKIETRRVERIYRGVGEDEIDRQTRRRKLPRASQHRRRDVDAEHVSGRADLLRQRDGGGAAAATDIDNPLACFGLGAIDQDIGDRRQHDVLRLLPIGPALAARSVPVRDLVGVQIVAYGRFHHALIRRAAGFGSLRRSSLRNRLGRAVAAHVAPGVGRALVGNVTERSLVGLFGFLLGRDLLRRLRLLGFPVSLGQAGFGRKPVRPVTQSSLRRG